MHQTTVRFGRDLWEVLEQEAERLGVSAAQYVRDATLTRLAYAAASQEEAVASRDAFAWAGGEPSADSAGAQFKERADAANATRPETPLAERVQAQVESAAAVQAQGKLARGKAERLRAEAEELRERKAEGRKR